MDAVMNSVQAQLGQIRAKLDDFPPLQKLEVRYRPASASVGRSSSASPNAAHFCRATTLHVYYCYYARCAILIPLFINTIGPNKCTKGIHHNRRWPRPLTDNYLRPIRRNSLLHHRLRLPRVQILANPRTPIARRRHPLANLLGRIFLLLDHRGIHRLPPVLDPVLLRVQNRVFAVGDVAPD